MDIIFDIDGTLSDPTHRRDFIATKPKNFGAFFAAQHLDPVHEDICYLLRLLDNDDNRIIVCTGREEVYRDVTQKWLTEVARVWYCVDRLYMRPKKDYRADHIIKEELLQQIRQDGYDPKMVFDDRNRVVEMWRLNGLRCLHVAEGNF